MNNSYESRKRIINIHLVVGYLYSSLLMYIIFTGLFGEFYKSKCADNAINKYLFICATIEIFVITYTLVTIHFVSKCMANIFQ